MLVVVVEELILQEHLELVALEAVETVAHQEMEMEVLLLQILAVAEVVALEVP